MTLIPAIPLFISVSDTGESQLLIISDNGAKKIVKLREAIRRIKASESISKINLKKAQKLDHQVKKKKFMNAGQRIVDTSHSVARKKYMVQ